jgi:endoglucanase
VETLSRSDLVYTSGRPKTSSETNGKSCNINHCLYQLYSAFSQALTHEHAAAREPSQSSAAEGSDARVQMPSITIPENEVVCIFDADQICSRHFFARTLPLMDRANDVAVVLSPQGCYNVDPACDLFNHLNVHFWEVRKILLLCFT